jgi:hypothetical protein
MGGYSKYARAAAAAFADDASPPSLSLALRIVASAGCGADDNDDETRDVMLPVEWHATDGWLGWLASRTFFLG